MSKNNNVCVVPGCNNTEENKITFHEFPLKNYELSLKWLDAVNRENWVPSRNSKVCSIHFKSTDFQIANAYVMKLKSDAVPSCHLYSPNPPPPPPKENNKEVIKIKEVEKCSFHVKLPPDAHFCCVWGCTINSVKQPSNKFHLLPINHQMTICDCIGLQVPIDPIDFLSKSLEICDQHFKQNAMLLYIDAEITSKEEPETKFHNREIVSTKINTNTITEIQDEIILKEEDLLHYNFSVNKLKNQYPGKRSILKSILTDDKKEQEKRNVTYDIDNICRICLNGGNLIQMEGKTYNKIQITEMLGRCINLKDPNEKKFPKKICRNCLITLRTVYVFLNDCKSSTNKLNKYLKEQNELALKSLQYDHDYNKIPEPEKPEKPRINLQDIMENAGIDVFDTFGSNDIEASVIEPADIVELDSDDSYEPPQPPKDTIPPDVINKIKNTKLKDSPRKIPKNILDTIEEKADLNIGGRKFILAKAFTCKKCKEIFFSQETFNEHVNVCDFKAGPTDQVTNKIKTCKKCQKPFKNQFDEITHKCGTETKKRKRNPLQCSKCLVRFRCLSFYASHTCSPEKLKRLEIAREKKRIIYRTCEVCKTRFTSRPELRLHIKSVHPEKVQPRKSPTKCGYCSLTFPSSDELKKHRNESHGQKRIVTCPTCMKRMTASAYANHKLVHSLERRYCCEFCGGRFKTQTNFRSHIAKVHLGLKPFACDICNRAYNTRTKMLDHRNVHLGVKKYMCDLCGARFTYKSCLASHIRKKRCGKTKGLAKDHPCPICDEVLKSKRLLIQHRREAHGRQHGNTKTYSCEVCKIPCESATDLRSHEVIHGIKKYICDKANCRRPFFTAERLSRHLKVHETINVQCEVCKKGFSSKMSLNMHIKTHTGEKNYHCTYCPKQFTQPGHLVTHTRTHTGAKPYQCPFCDRAFALNGNLTVHIRTHTGQRPYECDYCDQAFFDGSSRKRHMVQKHAMELMFNDNQSE